MLARAAGLTLILAAIPGGDGPRSDIKVMTWPSAHRAVVAEVAF